MGYWGEPTATINWCESDHTVSPYVAEWWNTVSNLLLVLVGIFGVYNVREAGLETRFHLLSVGIAFVRILLVCGLSNGVYADSPIRQRHTILHHPGWDSWGWSRRGPTVAAAALRYVEQQLDETPMVLSMLIWGFILYEPTIRPGLIKRIFAPALICYGLGFAAFHARYQFVTFFQAHFISQILVCAPRVRWYYNGLSAGGDEEQHAKRLAQYYVHTLVGGAACWLADHLSCEHMHALPVNPQGHAWWHIFMGLNCHFGSTFVQFCRAKELGMSPILVPGPLFRLPVVATTVKPGLPTGKSR